MQQTVLPTKDLWFWQARPSHSLLTFSPLNDRKGIEWVQIIAQFILAFFFFLKKKIVGKSVSFEDFEQQFHCFYKSPIQFTVLFSFLCSKT